MFQNPIASVYFLKSDCFNEDMFKIVVTRASPDDVVTAHKDVYSSKEEGVEPHVYVSQTTEVNDKFLFQQYISKLSNCIPHPNFFQETMRTKILDLVHSVNNLNSFVECDQRTF